jgi:hypothetical protein
MDLDEIIHSRQFKLDENFSACSDEKSANSHGLSRRINRLKNKNRSNMNVLKKPGRYHDRHRAIIG